MQNIIRLLSLIIVIAACSTLILAEEGVLVLSITNTTGEPVASITLKCKGDAPAGSSDRNGTARLKLPLGAEPAQAVILQIVAGDWALVSPWDGHVIVPSFNNSPQNFVTVVVAKKGDKQMLASGKVVEAIASRVLKDAGSKLDRQLSDEERRLALEAQAREYGLTPEEIEQAIREWIRKATGVEQKGLAELFNKNYPEAAKLLETSLEMKLKEVEELQNKAANNASFLGLALIGQGKYIAAAEAFKKALALRPEDGSFLYGVSYSYRMAGDLREAERYGKRSANAKTDDSRFGPYHPATANSYLNLAIVYIEEGKYAEAELTLKQALTITERTYGPDHSRVAECLDSYAELLLKLERKAEAEEKRTLASAIRARYEQHLREKAIAESKKLLALKEQQFGLNHSEVAIAAGSLGSLYQSYGMLAEAEMLLKRAMEIRKRTSGVNHPDRADDMYRLSLLYEQQGRYAEAEPLAKGALTILEKAYDQNNPLRILLALNSYARLLRRMDRRSEAANLEAKAKAIREKHNYYGPIQSVGPNSPVGPDEVPNRVVDPRLVNPAGVNAAGVDPANVIQINPQPGPSEGKAGAPATSSTPAGSKKPAKSKPRKRSSN